MQNIIGLSVMLLLFVIVLHASVAPTFVSGKLFIKKSAYEDKEFAKAYMVEYSNTYMVTNDFGSWAVPIRGGIPRKIRLQVLDSAKRPIDEISLVGPWPIVSAVYPREYYLVIHTYKPQGQRIEVTQGTGLNSLVAALMYGIGGVHTTYAQTVTVVPRVVVHVQGLGNILCTDGGWCGTKGENRRLEGFELKLSPPVPGLTLRYLCHPQDRGDTPWMAEGQFCGTRGESRRLEGFAIQLEGPEAGRYDVLYQAHLQNRGDTELSGNGAFVGTRGQSRVEAMRVWIEKRR